MTKQIVNSYHMTRAQAEYMARDDSAYVARPYPDRHGNCENGFKPDLSAWGIWDSRSDHWVFVHYINA